MMDRRTNQPTNQQLLCLCGGRIGRMDDRQTNQPTNQPITFVFVWDVALVAIDQPIDRDSSRRWMGVRVTANHHYSFVGRTHTHIQVKAAEADAESKYLSGKDICVCV